MTVIRINSKMVDTFIELIKTALFILNLKFIIGVDLSCFCPTFYIKISLDNITACATGYITYGPGICQIMIVAIVFKLTYSIKTFFRNFVSIQQGRFFYEEECGLSGSDY